MSQHVSKSTENNHALLLQIEELKQRNTELDNLYKESQKELKATQAKNARLEEHVHNLEQSLDLILNSKGHKLLDKYYTLVHKVKDAIKALKKGLKKIKNAPREFVSTLKRRKAKILTQEECYAMLKKCRRIDILAVKHTAYVAKLLQGILHNQGIESNILLEEPNEYENIPYIVICPQNFIHFPSLYVAFQMEQTVSQRWLTDEYFKILRNAYAVFDYSLVNVDYFSKDPELAKKLYYVPVDLCKGMAAKHSDSVEKEYDVLFYGATGNERRLAFLKRIGEKHNLKIISDCFGDALYQEMKKAKIIVNIHFYENALLETTRLYETLSVCDSLIISERSTDPNEETRLEDIVDFVDVGDIDAMLDRIEYWLSHEEERAAKTAENRRILIERANAAEFFLNRFLLANDRLSFDEFYQASGSFVHFEGDRVCLSLPETTERRAAFDEDNKYGFQIIPGLKHNIGWIGCGLSYKFIFRKALEQQLERILVCEDDVFFPPDFDERFRKVLEYTNSHDDWNIFSGIMADMGHASVLDYAEVDTEQFVYLDLVISMVFNLYDKSVFKTISEWDYMNRDLRTNAIDRYLEREKMRVLTAIPFLVGHKEDLDSTLWDGKNSIYNPGILSSSKRLHNMVDSYLYRKKLEE